MCRQGGRCSWDNTVRQKRSLSFKEFSIQYTVTSPTCVALSYIPLNPLFHLILLAVTEVFHKPFTSQTKTWRPSDKRSRDCLLNR